MLIATNFVKVVGGTGRGGRVVCVISLKRCTDTLAKYPIMVPLQVKHDVDELKAAVQNHPRCYSYRCPSLDTK